MNCQDFWNTIPELGNDDGSSHLSECPACAARMDRHRELEAGFRALAAGIKRMEAPPRVEARLRSAFRARIGQEGPVPIRRWVQAAAWATAVAAMFLLAAVLVRPPQSGPARPAAGPLVAMAALQPEPDSEGFIPLPNGAGVTADDDDVNLVRVEMRRGDMIALGFDVSADRAEEVVEADVMLGPDGMARAVRFVE